MIIFFRILFAAVVKREIVLVLSEDVVLPSASMGSNLTLLAGFSTYLSLGEFVSDLLSVLPPERARSGQTSCV